MSSLSLPMAQARQQVGSGRANVSNGCSLRNASLKSLFIGIFFVIAECLCLEGIDCFLLLFANLAVLEGTLGGAVPGTRLKLLEAGLSELLFRLG